MNKRIFLTPIFILLILLAGSCLKERQIINSGIQPVININNGDIVNIYLGNFGDEEGAGIYLIPHHAKVNQIDRTVGSSAIYYKYVPFDVFIGKDSVDIITYTGSDGSIGTGSLDTIRMRFIVKK